jgi:thymidylate synthase (FAD)
MNVKFISRSESPEFDTPEQLMVYCARVSSPNQTDENYEKLLAYCIKHKHWSIFELADMTVEITTTRAIAPQILRHRSFTFQEFSQRYAKATGTEIYTARRQDTKNRQNSIADMDSQTQEWFNSAQQAVSDYCFVRYDAALDAGIAKECARVLLPLSTITKLYMKGSLRSWIHYLQIRTAPETQKEHRDIAIAIQEIFIENFPYTATALGWMGEGL